MVRVAGLIVKSFWALGVDDGVAGGAGAREDCPAARGGDQAVVPGGEGRGDRRHRRDVAAGEPARIDADARGRWRGGGPRERGVAPVGLGPRDGDRNGVGAVDDGDRAGHVADRIVRVGCTRARGRVRRRRGRAGAGGRGRAAGLRVQRRGRVAVHETRIDRHDRGNRTALDHRGTERGDRQRGRGHGHGALDVTERVVRIHGPGARRRVRVPRHRARARRGGRTGRLRGQRGWRLVVDEAGVGRSDGWGRAAVGHGAARSRDRQRGGVDREVTRRTGVDDDVVGCIGAREGRAAARSR